MPLGTDCRIEVPALDTGHTYTQVSTLYVPKQIAIYVHSDLQVLTHTYIWLQFQTYALEHAKYRDALASVHS